jgi:hypothetical protein
MRLLRREVLPDMKSGQALAMTSGKVYSNLCNNGEFIVSEIFISLTGLVAGQKLYNFARRSFTSLVF